MEIAMIQDEIVPMGELSPALLDRGTFFGDGVYEVVRSYNGKIFALDEHLEAKGILPAQMEKGIKVMTKAELRELLKRAGGNPEEIF